MSDRNSKFRSRSARQFIRYYGRLRFRRLLQMISKRSSGKTIATEFGVSRERVRQWRIAFEPIAENWPMLETLSIEELVNPD